MPNVSDLCRVLTEIRRQWSVHFRKFGNELRIFHLIQCPGLKLNSGHMLNIVQFENVCDMKTNTNLGLIPGWGVLEEY